MRGGGATKHEYQPGRRVISVADARLNHMLLRGLPACASLSEYSSITGIPTEELLELLSGYLSDGSLAVEVAGDEVFLLTAPKGRPTPEECADVAPNLWEHLRRNAGPELAHDTWRLYRALERVGWGVEAQSERILEGLSHVADSPRLGVYIGQRVVPTLIFPITDDLADPRGVLTDYEQAGAAMVSVICAGDALESNVTAARRWLLAHRGLPARMSILILEAPRFSPVLLSSTDAAVSPVAVSQAALASYEWQGGA
jgi:hypothetical protein